MCCFLIERRYYIMGFYFIVISALLSEVKCAMNVVRAPLFDITKVPPYEHTKEIRLKVWNTVILKQWWIGQQFIYIFSSNLSPHWGVLSHLLKFGHTTSGYAVCTNIIIPLNFSPSWFPWTFLMGILKQSCCLNNVLLVEQKFCQVCFLALTVFLILTE